MILKNRKGNVLLFTLFGATIALGASVGIILSLNVFSKNTKIAGDMKNSSLATDTFDSIMADSILCTQLLTGKTITNNNAFVLPNSNNLKIILESQRIANYVVKTNATALARTNIDISITTPTLTKTQFPNKYFTATVKFSPVGDPRSYVYQIQAVTNMIDRIQSCKSNTKVITQCSEMGFVWDGVTERCKITKIFASACSAGEVFYGFDANGNVKCSASTFTKLTGSRN